MATTFATDKERAFVALVMSACELYGASVVTALRVAANCVEDARAGIPWSKKDIRNAVLRNAVSPAPGAAGSASRG